ncbi:MAG TPA: sigma-70 family RNA polymerase sigma factor [Gemmatimonadales bacterium]
MQPHDDVRLAQAGDEAAFERLYRANAGRVYALCLRLVADAGWAEDLVQDVFVRVWERLKTFRGESAFTSWLHRLTVNLVFATRRSSGRRGRREMATADLEDLGAAGHDAPPGLKLDLDQAIARLPNGARVVLVLYDIEGYGHDEISSMIGIAPGTSKAQLHRARRLMREALDR